MAISRLPMAAWRSFATGAFQQATCPPTGLASVRQIQFTGPRVGWLVGDGGLVRTTADGGQTWQAPPTEIPAEVRRTFDFCAVAVRGSQVWIAGSPGNRVFHSADWGRLVDGRRHGATCADRGHDVHRRSARLGAPALWE